MYLNIRQELKNKNSVNHIEGTGINIYVNKKTKWTVCVKNE